MQLNRQLLLLNLVGRKYNSARGLNQHLEVEDVGLQDLKISFHTLKIETYEVSQSWTHMQRQYSWELKYNFILTFV